MKEKMLHEILAVEKTKVEAAETLLRDTNDKFGKAHFFQGFDKTLKMIADSPENSAIEAAAREYRALPTSVYETLEYMFDIWADAEDTILQKNLTNTAAFADIILANGKTVATRVPVDELMGLEVRLGKVKGVLLRMPTVDASVKWVPDPDMGKFVYRSNAPQVTSKTEKKLIPVILHEATDKHPAQVREASKDEVVGTFTKVDWTSAVTAVQKSEVIKRVDDLITAIKAARMRANKVAVTEASIGKTIAGLILEPLL